METDPEFELDGFFPRDYLERKPQECKNAVYELYELICSTNIRDYIKPKYEYLLYAILGWWEDCADSEDDLIINLVDDQLMDALDNEKGQSILKHITDYEEYYYFCFANRDFLPFQLSNMDLHDSVEGILNSKYGLSGAREFTMGRAIKKLGETDLYIYREADGIVTDYAILENKYIENFAKQYKQLMGYLNPDFKFGITLSLNKKMSLKQGFDRIAS